jgi:tetratricopeptide (TPR) repeat protein
LKHERKRQKPPAQNQRRRAPIRLLPLFIAGTVVLAAGIAYVSLRSRPPAPSRPAASAAAAGPTDLSPIEAELRADLARRPREASARATLAKYLLDSGRPFEALWQFSAARESPPVEEASFLGMVRASAAAGLPGQAGKLKPGRPAASAAVAEVALSTGSAQDAQKVLSHESLKQSRQCQLLMGDAAYALGDFPLARAAYERAAVLDPQNADARDRLGRALLAAGKWEMAKAAFAQARDLAPRRPGPAFRLGLAYAGAGEGHVAEQIWQSVTMSAPRYAPAWRELGKSALHRRELPAAASHLVTAVRIDGSSEEAQRALAEAMEAQGDRASAHYQRGYAFLQSDQPHRALAEFHRMIELAPDRVDGPLMTSFAYVQMQRLDRAAAEAKRGLERHPNDTRLLARLGALHVLGRNRPLAKQLCQQWLQTEPNAVEPLRLLGRITREEQRLPESLRYIEQALAQEPENGMVCLEAAKTLTALGGPENTRRALESARKAVVGNPRDAESRHQLGVLLRSAGQTEDAAGSLLRALDLDATSTASAGLLVQIAAQQQLPQTSRFFAGLVTALEERARTAKALWRQVYDRPDDAAAHARLARFLLEGGDLRRARNQLRQVVALRPADGAAREKLQVVERLLELKTE